MRALRARVTLAVSRGDRVRGETGGSTMSTITSMFQSPGWRRAALLGFAIGFVAGVVPPLIT
jgi:hypothetical protein